MDSLLALLTAGCFSPTDKVIYKGTHNELDFMVKAHETRTWNGSHTDWVLKLDYVPFIPSTPTVGNSTISET